MKITKQQIEAVKIAIEGKMVAMKKFFPERKPDFYESGLTDLKEVLSILESHLENQDKEPTGWIEARNSKAESLMDGCSVCNRPLLSHHVVNNWCPIYINQVFTYWNKTIFTHKDY